MNKILHTSLACALVSNFAVSCRDEPQQSEGPSEWEIEEREASKAAYEREKAELAAIKYPECPEVWNGEKLSACGVQRLAKALEVCDERERGGYRLDPLSAGDSWIARAGRDSMQTVEERAERMEKGDHSEDLSYALGDGTNGIKIVSCSLADDMRLDGTWSSIR